MKKYCSLFMLLCSLSVKSKPVTLDVYLNFNECINCFISLSYINQLDTAVLTTLIIERNDSAVSQEFLPQYNLSKRIKLAYTDRSNTISVCRLYDNSALVEEFHLKEFPNKLSRINKLAKNSPVTRSYQLPKKLTIKNDRVDIFISGNYINIYDYILNKNITLKLKDSVQLVKEISGKSFNPDMFLQIKSDIDTAIYRRCKKTLQMFGKDVPHIEKAYLNDSSLFLLINFPSVSFENNDTVINIKFFQYEFNHITLEKKLMFVNDDAFSAAYKNKIFVNNAQPFYYHKQLFHYPLYYTDDKPEIAPFLSEWKKEPKKQVRFNKTYNLNFSRAEWARLGLDSNIADINSRFYFFGRYGVIYDYKQEKTYRLNNAVLASKNFIVDVCQAGDIFKLLIYMSEKPVLVHYNYKTNMVISSNAIELPEDYVSNTLKFYDENTVFSLNKTNTLMYLTSVK